MKKLYKFYSDYGRMGDLEGLFIADESDVDAVIGKEIYFGEVLGKHSDVSEVMEREMFSEITVPIEALEVLEKELGSTWSGFNPIDIYNEQVEESE